MKTFEVEQGSSAWLEARAGYPTCSELDRIITPTGKRSTQAVRYMGRLVAEYVLGRSLEDFSTAYTDRGIELEPTAIAAWEFSTDTETTKVGFCLRDDGLLGGSPDRIKAGGKGLLEIKVPGIEQFMAYLLDDGRSLVADHWCQIQGQLFVGEGQWDHVEIMAWNPDFGDVRKIVEPDERFQNQIHEALTEFDDALQAAKRKFAPLKADRERAAERAMEVADVGPF